MHCLTAWGQKEVDLLQCTASLPGGSGQLNFCKALSHCLGAVGSGTPSPVCVLVVLCVRYLWPLHAWSLLCLLRFCVCCVLGLLARVHQCLCLVCGVCGVLRCKSGVRGPLTLVHRCACLVFCLCSVFGLVVCVRWGAHLVCGVCGVRGLLARCSPAWLLGALFLRCPWLLGACSALRALGVWCMRCPWPLGAYSAVCVLDVLCVRYPWPLGAC